MCYLSTIRQVIFINRDWYPKLKDSNSTTCTQSYLTNFRQLDVKTTLVLNHAIIKRDQLSTSYNNSMSYSYCCSQLNRRFYIPPVIPTLLLQCYPHLQSQNDISLAYSSSIRLPLPNRKCTKPSTFTLSYFRSLFNDHRRPSYTM